MLFVFRIFLCSIDTTNYGDQSPYPYQLCRVTTQHLKIDPNRSIERLNWELVMIFVHNLFQIWTVWPWFDQKNWEKKVLPIWPLVQFLKHCHQIFFIFFLSISSFSLCSTHLFFSSCWSYCFYFRQLHCYRWCSVGSPTRTCSNGIRLSLPIITLTRFSELEAIYSLLGQNYTSGNAYCSP